MSYVLVVCSCALFIADKPDAGGGFAVAATIVWFLHKVDWSWM